MHRSGAAAPCADCCLEFADKMQGQGRCQRPETVFALIRGEVIGICADDPEYAQVLAGTYLKAGVIQIGVWPAPTPRWVQAIRQAWPRANRENQRPIQEWLKLHGGIL